MLLLSASFTLLQSNIKKNFFNFLKYKKKIFIIINIINIIFIYFFNLYVSIVN